MKNKSKAYQVLLITILCILCALVVLPFLLLVSISFSEESDIVYNGYKLWPENFSVASYRYLLGNSTAVFDAYKVTIFYSLVGMALSVLLTAMMAYPLTRRNLKGRKFMSFYIYFTMLFGGGMVPSYILITQYLHLDNTLLVYIIPGLMSPWNVFMARSFFSDLPEEMIESAKIDGATEYRIFFNFVIPLSKPVLATIALNVFLLKWNEWMTCMLYITNSKLYSLQYLLQSIMENIRVLQEAQASGTGLMLSESEIPAETVRMAMAVIAAGPAVLVFPFFQKYFVKGMTVGSVKG